MPFEPKIFEGTWKDALDHAESISQNQNVVIIAMEPKTDREPITTPINPNNEASIALLRKWRANAPTEPQAIQEAEEDLQEFMENINAERKKTGARLIYPEV